MTIRSFFAALVVALTLGLFALPAAADTPFTTTALAKAQASGKAVLVDVFAPWCPTCRAQNVVLDRLRSDERFKSFVRLRVDFDNQKDELRALGANSQSTLIVYKGKREVGRLVGVTSPEAIEALLSKGL